MKLAVCFESISLLEEQDMYTFLLHNYLPSLGMMYTLNLSSVRSTVELLVESRTVNTSQNSANESSMISICTHCCDLVMLEGSNVRVKLDGM